MNREIDAEESRIRGRGLLWWKEFDDDESSLTSTQPKSPPSGPLTSSVLSSEIGIPSSSIVGDAGTQIKG